MAYATSERTSIISTAQADFKPAVVSINSDAIRRFDWGNTGGLHVELKPGISQTDTAAMSFLVAMTALNYRFWQIPEGSPSVLQRYVFAGKTGARALWSAFEAAWGEASAPAQFVSAVTDSTFAEHFGEFLATPDRLAIVRELFQDQGRKLTDVCQTLSGQIAAIGAITVSDAYLLEQEFPKSFADPYLKKAQLALAMYGGHHLNRGLRLDTSDLTAIADYQVPRVLRAMGILNYDATLSGAVDNQVQLPQDSHQERAIRSATILACEEIATYAGITAAAVDNALWQAQAYAGEQPFHLTFTTRY